MGMFDGLTDAEYVKKHYEIFGACYLCETYLEQHPPEDCPDELRLCCCCNDIISCVVCEVISPETVLEGHYDQVLGGVNQERTEQVIDYILDINEKANNILQKGGVVIGLHRQTVRHNARICAKYGWL